MMDLDFALRNKELIKLISRGGGARVPTKDYPSKKNYWVSNPNSNYENKLGSVPVSNINQNTFIGVDGTICCCIKKTEPLPPARTLIVFSNNKNICGTDTQINNIDYYM